MAWNDASEIRVAANGQVYVAPVGTALPTTPTGALNAAFVGLGYTTEDGVGFSVGLDINEIKSWQSRQPTRRDLVGQEISASFGLQQWNEETVPLAFGGGAITTISGGYRYDFPEEGDALDEYAMVIDAVDDSTNMRFVLVRGNVVEAVETKFQRGEAAVLPITFKALEPSAGGAAAYFLSDGAGFLAGS